MRERPFSVVPRGLAAVAAMLFALQLGWRTQISAPVAQLESLSAPPSVNFIRLSSLGEPSASAGLLALRLQAFDNQPGISLPFSALDYRVLVAWLERLLEVDGAAHYPLLMASHLYAQVPDRQKQIVMLDFVYREFFVAPNTRWPYLAHAALIAKHELHDMPRALRYARAIQNYATGPKVPHWAQEMPIFILEDMGQLEAATRELGALLASGTIRDPQEKHFLSTRYAELQSRLSRPRQDR